ncbi:hypothetical protein [Geodermatophilus sp. SYSU D00700]
MALPDRYIAAGRVAALTRSRTDDDPELVQARRDLALGRAAQAARQAVAALPQDVTPDELDELARLVYRDRW